MTTRVPQPDSHTLNLVSRPRLSGDQPIWQGALALSLLLHGVLLLTEFRPWQHPQSSSSQTQHISLSLTAPPKPERLAVVAESLTKETLVEPAPALPEPGIEESVVVTREASTLVIPTPALDRVPIQEPNTDPEPPPIPGSTTLAAPTDKASLTAIEPSKSGFSDADRDALMDDYLQEIRVRLQRAFEYPSAALKRRQHGEVVLQLLIDDSGHIVQVMLYSGSGYSLLDNAAVAMVRRLAPLPPLPEHFPDGALQLGVPVVFQLQ